MADSESSSSPGLAIAQSFAKNFGLYGERVGSFHLSLPASCPTTGAYSQILRLIRAEISNPPLFGARIVQIVLSDPELEKMWKEDLRKMSSRIKEVRTLLKAELDSGSGNGDWTHLVEQIGMFSYTGLTEAQVERLKSKHHVYMMRSGRASLSGANESNVRYIAEAFAEVIRYGRS